MSPELLQFLITGLTLGAMYALAAVGFSMVYAASGLINFAQGEFIMVGGMVAATSYAAGAPLAVAVLLGISASCLCGVLVEKLAVAPARRADPISLIIITMGAALVIRGVVQATLGKDSHGLPAFSGEGVLHIGGATFVPQVLWVLGATLLAAISLAYFFFGTVAGKAMRAVSYNQLAAQLLGIGLKRTMLLAFLISAALGGIGGVVLAPITYTNFDIGTTMALKGFTAATLGGLGSVGGALAGGLVLGVAEALAAGYVSSAYKDAVAFLVLIAVLFVRPQGIFGARASDRV